MNREIVIPGGAGLYPLTGDVQSSPGSNTASVVGIHGVPVTQTAFNGGEFLEYNVNTHTWSPTLRATVQVNNLFVSDDNIVTVNVPKPILVNGA